MEDESVKREVWEGKVPVCFSVAGGEVGLNMAGERVIPEPCYMLISRVTFFPFFYDRLEKLYARALKADRDDEMWLSSEDMPLKWHYPVGVLYDLYGRGSRLPWNITVHFKNFPEDDILHCSGKEALESYFKSKIKEADFIKHRSEIIQSLTPQEFALLWDSLRQCNFDDFWTVNKKMMLNARAEHEPFRNIPFCIYQNGKHTFQRLLSHSNSSQQDPTRLTLRDLIQLYNSHHQIPSVLQEMKELRCERLGTRPPLRTDLDHCVLIHGIELSPETPLQWLSEHFSYPDNFLHVCVVPKCT